jgi:uncharacterized protein YkwD
MPLGLVRPSRYVIALALGLALLAMGAVQKAQPAFALTNCSVSDSFDSEERAFLQLINNYRAQYGKAPLTVSTNLNRSSAWLAQDLATKNYFAHTDSLGRDVPTRLSQCDTQPYSGENIAAGTNRDTAQEAFVAWRASAGHNKNMLNDAYQQIGIARYYNPSSRYTWYWVTDFSTSNDGTNAMGSSSSSGSGSTSSPPPPPPPPAPSPSPTAQPPASPVSQAAQLSSPGDGSTLSNSEVFRWNAVNGARGYRIDIGTKQGWSNLLSANLGRATAISIRGFPSNGATIYIRLWTQLPSGWVYNDYQYRLSN